MNINLFALMGLLVGILCLSMAIFSLLAGKSKIYLLVGAFNFAVSLWGWGGFIAGISSDSLSALLGWKIANFGGYFIAVIFYHLICHLCHLPRKTLLILGYGQAFIFGILTLFSSMVMAQTRSIYSINYYVAKPAYVLAFLLYLFFVLLSFYELFRSFESKQGIEKKQIVYVLVGFFIGFLGGTSLILPAFGLSFHYPIGNVGICLYALILTYAMIYLRLFDIEFISQAFQREKLAQFGLIAACINHEVKNSLYVAKNIIDIQLDKSQLKGEAIQPETLHKSLAQIERAFNMMRQLNEFVRPAAAAAANQCASVTEALERVLDLISHELTLQNITVDRQIDHNLPDLKFDQHQLEEVLFNLVINAYQAMKKMGGRLTVKAYQETKGRRGLTPAGGQPPMDSQSFVTIISISDTGLGMTQSQIDHIVEPFYTTKSEGTGLGLYITKQLVEKNGGKIKVQSDLGHGTIFKLELSKA